MGGGFRSAFEIPTYIGGRWTPDFSLGPAQHETEAFLTRYHVTSRASVLVSSGVRLLGRPDDVVAPLRSGAGLLVSGAALASTWSRSRAWRSLQDPSLLRTERWIGAIASSLHLSGARPDSLAAPGSWALRPLSSRLGAAASFSPDPRGLTINVAAVVAPAVARRAVRTAPGLTSLALVTATTALSGAGVAIGVRRCGRRLDDEIDVAAATLLDELYQRESASFLAELVEPAPAVLQQIRRALDADPDEARRLAANAEERVRRWLELHESTFHRADVAFSNERRLEVEREVALASRQVQAFARAVNSVGLAAEVLLLRRVPGPWRRTLAAALVVRSGVAAVTATDQGRTWSGARHVRLVRTGVEVATAVASTGYLSSNPSDAAVHGLVDRASHDVAAGTSASRLWSGWVLPAVASGARSAILLARSGTRRQGLANAAAEVIRSVGDGLVMRDLLGLGTSQAALVGDRAIADRLPTVRARLDELHTAQTALVHDGLAQVLGAVSSGALDTPQLQRWLDSETARMQRTKIEGAIIEATPSSSLCEMLDGLRRQFVARGLDLTVLSDGIPRSFDVYKDPLALVVREALSNAMKHGEATTAVCSATLVGGEVVVSIVSNALPDASGGTREGGGTGFRTIARAAQRMNAGVEWRPLSGRSPELRITLPAPGSSDSSSDGSR